MTSETLQADEYKSVELVDDAAGDNFKIITDDYDDDDVMKDPKTRVDVTS